MCYVYGICVLSSVCLFVYGSRKTGKVRSVDWVNTAYAGKYLLCLRCWRAYFYRYDFGKSVSPYNSVVGTQAYRSMITT